MLVPAKRTGACRQLISYEGDHARTQGRVMRAVGVLVADPGEQLDGALTVARLTGCARQVLIACSRAWLSPLTRPRSSAMAAASSRVLVATTIARVTSWSTRVWSSLHPTGLVSAGKPGSVWLWTTRREFTSPLRDPEALPIRPLPRCQAFGLALGRPRLARRWRRPWEGPAATRRPPRRWRSCGPPPIRTTTP
jgi:hypothetical protein